MMRLKDPKGTYIALVDRGLVTYVDMQDALDLAYNTLTKALAGKPVSPRTISKFATGLGLRVLDVGEFVENSQ